MTTQAQIEDVYYANTNTGELTARQIITTVPKPNTLAIDVTALSIKDKLDMMKLYQRYLEYADAYHKNIISFENWAAQSDNISIDPQWRAFVTAHLIRK